MRDWTITYSLPEPQAGGPPAARLVPDKFAEGIVSGLQAIGVEQVAASPTDDSLTHELAAALRQVIIHYVPISELEEGGAILGALEKYEAIYGEEVPDDPAAD